MSKEEEHALSNAEVLRVNQELDAQLRELVRTQQRLFLSERENARQLGRLESLTAFAIAAAELTDASAVLGRAASVVFEHFPFEQSVGFVCVPNGLSSVAVSSVEGLAGKSVSRLEVLREERVVGACPDTPVFGTKAQLLALHDLAAPIVRLEALFGPSDAGPEAPMLALPLARSGREPVGVMLFRRVSAKRSFHEEFPSKSGMAFLTLMANHLAVTLANERAQTALVARERLAALGELSAQVAHEVRNPLGAIFNALSLLRPIVGDGTSDGERLVGILEEEASRINAIVSQLLEFARPSSSARQREPLAPIVVAAIDAMKSAVPSVEVRIEADEDLPLAPVDARLLRHAFVNLLVNAAQATDDGEPIHVRIVRDGAAVRVDVENVGPRIPEAMLDRVFEPFFTTKASGTGLGLSVVKRAIDAHGGLVRVTSSEQRTVFTVVLPAS